MTSAKRPRVLDVGQCAFDHGNISAMLAERFSVHVDQTHTVHEAIERVANVGYDLVLVNRILDGNGQEGLDLVRGMKADERVRATPVMLVSNYDEAQAAAVAAGAVRGFGKSAIADPQTAELLAEYLGRPSDP